MIWAADNTNLGQTEAFIGAARALEIVYSGAIYSAEQFEKWHIVNKVPPAADLEDRAMKFAKRPAKGPTRARFAGE